MFSMNVLSIEEPDKKLLDQIGRLGFNTFFSELKVFPNAQARQRTRNS